jgi:hypothetical protein
MEDAKAKCPTCGSAFPAGATYCPECGYVVPVSAPAAAPPVPKAAAPSPQSNVVYVQPPAPAPAPAPREANWGPWVAIAALVILVGGGVLLWNGGYLGGGNAPTPAASNVTIENSPQMSTETPPATMPPQAQQPAATPPPATPPAAVPPSNTPVIDIVSVTGHALDTSPTAWKYGYTVRLRNNTAAAVKVNLRVQFLDDKGFPLDDALMNDLAVPANTELSFDGDTSLSTSLAQRIKTLRAEVR